MYMYMYTHTHITIYNNMYYKKICVAHVQKCTYRFVDVTIIFSKD